MSHIPPCALLSSLVAKNRSCALLQVMVRNTPNGKTCKVEMPLKINASVQTFHYLYADLVSNQNGKADLFYFIKKK